MSPGTHCANQIKSALSSKLDCPFICPVYPLKQILSSHEVLSLGASSDADSTAIMEFDYT